MKRLSQDTFIILVLVGLVFIFFYKIIFSGLTFFIRDLLLQFYPWVIFTKESLSKGNIPLWNPYNFCGMPFLANMQSGIFYPLKIFFYLVPFVLAYKLFIIFNFLLAGLLMYFLARQLAWSPRVSLISGIIFMCNGYLISRVEFLSIVGTIIWLPGALLFLKKAMTGKNNKSTIFFLSLSGIVLALQFLAGHAQMLFYSLLLLSLYSLVEAIDHRSLKPFLLLAGAGLLGWGLSMIQFLPANEFIKFSTRGGQGIGLEVATTFSLPPQRLLGLIYPFFFEKPATEMYQNITDFWVTNFYIGIIPFILGLIAVFSKKFDKIKYFLILTLILTIILALGKYTPVYTLLYRHLSIFRVMRYPATIMYLVVFIFALLAGIGLEKIRKRFLITKSKKAQYLVETTLILLIFIDLFYFSMKFQILLDNDIFAAKGQDTVFLEKNLKGHRFFLTPKTSIFKAASGVSALAAWLNFKDRLYANINLNSHLFNVGGQDVMVKDYDDFLNFVSGRKSAIQAQKFLELLGVKYILSLDKISGPQYTLIEDGEPKIYQNNKYLEQVFFVPQYKILPQEKILEYMESDSFSPEHEVVIEDKIDRVNLKSKPYSLTVTPGIQIVNYEPNSVTIEANLTRPGWLVFTDTYYPDWQVFINGIKNQIFKADYTFRALYLNAGTSKINFVYFPRAFKLGLYITISIIILGTFFALNLIRSCC